jgi:hypothetical protein
MGREGELVTEIGEDVESSNHGLICGISSAVGFSG